MEEKELIERLVENEQRTKSLEHRVDDAEIEIGKIKDENKVMHEMNTNIAVMLNEMKSMNEKVDSTNAKVDNTNKKVDGLQKEVTDIKLQPAHKWNKVVWLTISGVVGFVLSYFLNIIIK